MNRRRRDLIYGTAALGLSRALAASENELPRRELGATGLRVSIFGLGGAPTGNLPEHRAAVDIVKQCYDSGVNYFDTAAAGAYGLSQARYGDALKGLRDKVVFATKTRHRTATQAELDLNQSLTNLRTDYIDLYQIHNVINEEDIEFIFARNGVLEMIEKARKAGKVRFVGVTGHTEPAILNRLISRHKFDTILMPLSATDGAHKQRSFEKLTLPLAREKNMGVIAMKTLGAGAFLRDGLLTAKKALDYVWTLPVSSAILGCSEPAHVRADAALAREFKPLSASAMEQIRQSLDHLALERLEPWKARTVGVPSGYRAD